MAEDRGSGTVGHSDAGMTVASPRATGNSKIVSRSHMQEPRSFVRFLEKLVGVVKTTSDRSCNTFIVFCSLKSSDGRLVAKKSPDL
jgi:hypothetical protein